MGKLITLILIFAATLTYGQVDQTIWDSLKTVTTDNYEIKFPYNWRQMPTDGNDPQQFLEASGLALSSTFNGSPVIMTIFIVIQEGKDLQDCKKKCLDGYRSNSDRKFPNNFEDGEEKIKLSDGKDAYLLNTRFYRKSKGLNQSRYDLVVYSEKAKSGFLYTISIQYADETYKFEADNELANFAKKLYSYLDLKD